MEIYFRHTEKSLRGNSVYILFDSLQYAKTKEKSWFNRVHFWNDDSYIFCLVNVCDSSPQTDATYKDLEIISTPPLSMYLARHQCNFHDTRPFSLTFVYHTVSNQKA